MSKNFLSPLASAINHYLKLDPESKTRITKLKNKMIAIELLPLKIKFYCEFTDDGVHLEKKTERTPETIITGTPLQMLGVMLHRSKRHQFFSDDVTISGDAELGQQTIELFDEMQIDWEEHLAALIGDVTTEHISQLIKRSLKWARNTEKSFTDNISDYIHEEKEWLPARVALQDFFNDVDTLRMDVDRLEARLNNLKRE